MAKSKSFGTPASKELIEATERIPKRVIYESYQAFDFEERGVACASRGVRGSGIFIGPPEDGVDLSFVNVKTASEEFSAAFCVSIPKYVDGKREDASTSLYCYLPSKPDHPLFRVALDSVNCRAWDSRLVLAPARALRLGPKPIKAAEIVAEASREFPELVRRPGDGVWRACLFEAPLPVPQPWPDANAAATIAQNLVKFALVVTTLKRRAGMQPPVSTGAPNPGASPSPSLPAVLKGRPIFLGRPLAGGATLSR